jgi:transcriptional regulator with XRE-family HTH domain
VERGWDAKDRLKPLWQRCDWTRDDLAAATGITPQTLSAYNTGNRPLGMRNARRIAAALEVSVLDLGAPNEDADDLGRTLQEELAALIDELEEIRSRLDALESRQQEHEHGAQG